jgi:hypothetical protein
MCKDIPSQAREETSKENRGQLAKFKSDTAEKLTRRITEITWSGSPDSHMAESSDTLIADSFKTEAFHGPPSFNRGSRLLSAIAGGLLMEGDFPFEPTRFKLSGKRVCTSPQQSLEKDWGYQTAQSLYAKKDIIRKEDFHLVWWDGLDSAMAGYPKMYRVWLTKHVSEFCGSNVQLYY